MARPASARPTSAWGLPALISLALFVGSLALYLSRMAPSVVPGDPGEYQLVAARWGIAHPPGYGLYAFLGNLVTHLVPFGTFAWRANLFSALCAAAIVPLAYAIGRTLSARRPASARPTSAWATCSGPGDGGIRKVPGALSAFRDHFPSLVGALVLATGIDLWQHAVHANAHVLTALLATCTLYLLLRWWRTASHPWLYAAAFVAGLSPVQHPLLVFAFPAYLLFGLIVLVDRVPSARRGRVLGTTIAFALLGLAAYLYYPIRSAIGPPPTPGPTDMHTWSGFIRVVTAQGLRGNLGGFTLPQVLQRLWDVRVPLRLQYTLPGLFLAAIGFLYLWRPRQAGVGTSAWQPALLLTAYLACILLVTVNVLQDQMAYLLGPIVVVGVLIGLGIEALLVVLPGTLPGPVRRSCGFHAAFCSGEPGASPGAARRNRGFQPTWSALSSKAFVVQVRRRTPALVALAALLLPISSLVVNWQRMDLSDFRDADLWLQQVESRFVGQGRHVALLTEWERMTTVYYYAAVERRTWDERDLRFVPIYAGTEAPFLQACDDNLPHGPVYLTTYRPEVSARYRLMPSGNLWQVLPAWPRQLPTLDDNPLPVQPIHADQDRPIATAPPSIEIVGWTLDRQRAQPGDLLLLDLYMRLPAPDASSGAPGSLPYYLPWARLGDTTYHFTTGSRFNTPWWQPGEIVVERFELPVPWSAPPGPLSLQVGLWLVNEGRALDLEGGQSVMPHEDVGLHQETVALTELEIVPAPWRPSERKLERALGNLRGDILLREARVNGRSVRSSRPAWLSRPVSARPGTRLRVVLEWESLRPIDDNLKVFVQLLDANLQVRAQGDDKAPLGGSAPTWLWFPRWRRGTRITDTYFLDLPSDLPPGSYPLVVGMYGFSTFKRVQALSPTGDMDGDWITLGHLTVGPGSSRP